MGAYDISCGRFVQPDFCPDALLEQPNLSYSFRSMVPGFRLFRAGSRLPMEIRFRPNIRASTDQAPGPNMASPAAIAEAVIGGQKFRSERPIQSSRMAAKPPAKGVP